MTPTQCRQARRLLGMTLVELSAKAKLTPQTVSLYERTGHLATERVSAIKSALEAAGTTFTNEGALVESVPVENMSGQQCREARRLLGWTQRQLGDAAGVSHNSDSKFEARGTRLSPRRDFHRAGKIRAALEAVGVGFIAENGGGPGVRLRASGGSNV